MRVKRNRFAFSRQSCIKLKRENELERATEYKIIGQYKEAINVCYSIVNWEKEVKARILIASCFEQLGKFHLALKMYLTIPRLRRNAELEKSMEQCSQAMQQEKNKKVKTLYSYERSGPITFFTDYNSDSKKGVTCCTYQKADILQVESINEYMEERQIYIPHIEALDLAVSSKMSC